MAGHNTVDHADIPSGIGENCAMNVVTGSEDSVAQALMSQWMSSPGHKENILRRDYTCFGVGVTISKGYVYAVQDFRF